MGTPSIHAAAKIRSLAPPANGVAHPTLDEARSRATTTLDIGAFYQALGAQGLQYGRAFRPIEQVWCGDREAVGLIHLRLDEAAACAGYNVHPVLLDGSFQLVAAAIRRVRTPGTYIPLGIETFELRQRARTRVWGYVHVEAIEEGAVPEVITASTTLFDEDGRIVARASGLSLRRISALRSSADTASRARLQSVADRPGWHYWEREMDSATLPDGVYGLRDGAILHVAAFAEMARAIARELLGTDACAVSALQLHNPLVVSRGRRHRVQTSISTEGPGGATVRVHSQPLGERDVDAGWTLHATASVMCNGDVPVQRN